MQMSRLADLWCWNHETRAWCEIVVPNSPRPNPNPILTASITRIRSLDFDNQLSNLTLTLTLIGFAALLQALELAL